MSNGIESLNNMVVKSIRSVVRTGAFSDWFKQQKANDGDVIIINNSFIYRKPLIKTSKNPQYLSLTVKAKQPDLSHVHIVGPGDLNSDFKLLAAKSGNIPAFESLSVALQKEIKKVGRLVLVLIGELEESSATVPVDHALVKELTFDPLAKASVVIEKAGNKKAIIVNQLTDPETAWNAIRSEFKQDGNGDSSNFEKPFASAFEQLQEEARLALNLPRPATTKSGTQTSFIARLRQSVGEQRKLYEDALDKCSGKNSDGDVHRRDVMRIAYNFADDAVRILQLLVGIADLKGVLLWCTIKEHFDVAEAFRKLPWTKSTKKPSLERYREIISGARNRAFHNLLAFDRTIRASLAGVQVNALSLTLLPPHGRRKGTPPFDYEDREMVEILTELTRAPEVAVPFEFWEKNAVVMECFEKLLERTEDALWALNQARQ